MIEVEKLVNITVELILKYSISDIQNIKPTRANDLNNFWNLICIKYFGFIKYNNALMVFTWQKRDTKNYSSLTKLALEGLKETEKMDIDSLEKNFIIPISSKE